MAVWGYVAIDKGGKEIKGSKDADNKDLVLRDLKNQGLIVLELTEQNRRQGPLSGLVLPAVCQHHQSRCYDYRDIKYAGGLHGK